MKKKKLAICANGWNMDNLTTALRGIKKYAAQEDFDIYVFQCFASYSTLKDLTEGELNIYKLMHPADYDGVIVFSSALNSVETVHEICDQVRACKVPLVSIGMDLEGIPSICGSNIEGMRDLVTHLVEKHGVKHAFFIGGTPDHVDSIARLEVTRQVFAEHGLSLTEEDLGYGKWTNSYTADLIDRYLDSGRPLPDAFICANDIMAMAACTELTNRGVDVPKNVIVTGFDDIPDGKIFYPALSSVEQNYEEIGETACRMILDQLQGKEAPALTMVPSRFVCAESCRCKGERDFEMERRDYCRHLYRKNSNALLLEQNQRVMLQYLSDMPNYEALKDTLEEHYQRSHQFEGEGFYICLNREYFRNIMTSEKQLWAMKDDTVMEAFVSLVHGEIRQGLPVDFSNIVPGYEKVPGEQHVFFFLPMHYLESNYGYVVFTDFPYIMQQDMLYPYMEKLQQALRVMRTNLRLKELYDKDQLTGLFNRFCYEDKVIPLYQESLEKADPMTIMFVDINYMKLINDKFGHLHGDNAILTVVDAIRKSVPRDAVSVRFGGDEFLLIVPGCGPERAQRIRESIARTLEQTSEEKKLPYQVTASIGYVVTDPAGRRDAELQDYIREADQVMYGIKKEMHEKNDRRKRS